MTPAVIIARTLKTAGIVGVGNTASYEDLADAFMVLNDMLAGWSRKRWLVYHLVDKAFLATGAASYSVGPGGDIDMVRPDKIETAFVRLLGNPALPVDVPLQVIEAEEDWAGTAVKGLVGFPQAVFLNSDYPYGTLYVWPIPSAAVYEVHVVFKADLVQFGTPTEQVNLPPEYMEAIRYNLAGRLLIEYDKPQRPDIAALAKASLNAVRNANYQVPLLEMPRGLPGMAGGYNVMTDR